jgi:predicted RNA-binding Zn-ribbon protein involved in translation (DUF1610 family)
MQFKSIYKCPECGNYKEIYISKCKTCNYEHSFLERFKEIVKESHSYIDCRNKVNLEFSTRTSRQTITRLIEQLHLKINHFNGGRGRFYYTKERILIINSPANQQILKSLIQRENIIPYICSECNNEGWWNNKPLTLQLDHINGDKKDNRLENLHYLCPNCHTQTPTYCGKKGKGIKKIRHK